VNVDRRFIRGNFSKIMSECIRTLPTAVDSSRVAWAKTARVIAWKNT
jgi:hypothetical protein